MQNVEVGEGSPVTLWSSAHFCLNCSSEVRKSSSSHVSSFSLPVRCTREQASVFIHPRNSETDERIKRQEEVVSPHPSSS